MGVLLRVLLTVDGIAAVMIISVILGLAQAKVEIVENFHGTYAIHIYINETERPNAVGTGHFCAFDSEEVRFTMRSMLKCLHRLIQTYCCSNNHTQYAQWTASSQRALNNATGHNFTCPFEMWGEFEEMNTLVLIFFIVPMAMAVLVISKHYSSSFLYSVWKPHFSYGRQQIWLWQTKR